MKEELWLIEYSQSQKSYNFNLIEDTIKVNMERLKEGKKALDFVVIGYAYSIEEARQLCDMIDAEFDIKNVKLEGE